MAEPVGHRPLLQRVRAGWADALLSLLCVVLAGSLVTWLRDEPTSATIDGAVGKAVPLSTSGQMLEVTDRRVAQRVARAGGSSAITTPDEFLAVRLLLRTPGERVENAVSCELHQGGQVVQPVVDAALSTPEPGFETVVDLAFERPADGLVGAQLACRPRDMIRAYSRELVVDLGVDQPALDGWRQQAGRELSLDFNLTTEVIS